ncbi:hypothetical protein SNOG_00462 [Parastagonospora nodorum SN15]|uniref:Uncharacterized protein n=1 Tax=Phaeosphaeria nodorum (strain SN15 / ATCC MYA-4574 / FGSC 10173) TaxID=321614 RepID=Q0V6A2_PHANO|nr:hypothetical protein SNOG_00462 [Parastagonospora nodorum SN15]EAT91957.1 hypothetical protein SNOG_00462 [Parastagonospora nodorum SN15]
MAAVVTRSAAAHTRNRPSLQRRLSNEHACLHSLPPRSTSRRERGPASQALATGTGHRHWHSTAAASFLLSKALLCHSFLRFVLVVIVLLFTACFFGLAQEPTPSSTTPTVSARSPRPQQPSPSTSAGESSVQPEFDVCSSLTSPIRTIDKYDVRPSAVAAP